MRPLDPKSGDFRNACQQVASGPEFRAKVPESRESLLLAVYPTARSVPREPRGEIPLGHPADLGL